MRVSCRCAGQGLPWVQRGRCTGQCCPWVQRARCVGQHHPWVQRGRCLGQGHWAASSSPCQKAAHLYFPFLLRIPSRHGSGRGSPPAGGVTAWSRCWLLGEKMWTWRGVTLEVKCSAQRGTCHFCPHPTAQMSMVAPTALKQCVQTFHMPREASRSL